MLTIFSYYFFLKKKRSRCCRRDARTGIPINILINNHNNLKMLSIKYTLLFINLFKKVYKDHKIFEEYQIRKQQKN